MKLLIVEDEAKIADSLKEGLEQERHVVDLAYDGEDGYDLASSEEYDIIILDRMLPKLSGTDILSRIREEGNKTPVLFLTAKSQTKDKVEGLNLGADDYLVKPFSFDELLARIEALGRRPRNAHSVDIRVRDVSLKSDSYTAYRAGKTIELSQREYQLLELLMRQSPRILSKEQIMSRAWPFDANILPNTVEVHMKHVRDKIDKPFNSKKPLIHTVRGFGYKAE